jgi:hypothetical protein
MIQLHDVRIVANNKDVAFIANSFKYTEGLGEQSVTAVSSGGGGSEQLFADDVSTHFSMFSFEIPVTPDTVKDTRDWKTRLNNNVFQAIAENSDGEVLKTFAQAALVNDYEVAFGVDTTITLEFKSAAAK